MIHQKRYAGEKKLQSLSERGKAIKSGEKHILLMLSAIFSDIVS